MICPQCYTNISDGISKCPSCNATLEFGRLSNTAGSLAIEKVITGKIIDEQADGLLQKMKESDELLSHALINHQSYIKPDEIDGIINMQGEGSDSWENNMVMMITSASNELNLGGIELDQLIAGNHDIKKVLQTGVKLIRKGKHTEAIEWWTLQRQKPDVLPQSDTELLYLLMEMLTSHFANDVSNVNQLISKIRVHSSFINKLSRQQRHS